MLWLDATTIPVAHGGTISSWKDLGSRQLSLTQGTAGDRPIMDMTTHPRGMPMVNFVSSDNLAVNDGLGLEGADSPFTAFVVGRITAASLVGSTRAWCGLVSQSNNNTTHGLRVAEITGTNRVSTFRRDDVAGAASANDLPSTFLGGLITVCGYAFRGTTMRMEGFNGASSGFQALDVGTCTFDKFAVGGEMRASGGVALLVGQIGEVIYFNRELDPSQYAKVARYLKRKWSATATYL